MPLKSFLLFRPKTFHKTAEQYYHLLKKHLHEFRIPWEDYYSRGKHPEEIGFHRKDHIIITWHTKGVFKNTWHLKQGPFEGFLECDQMGYAGFSSIRNQAGIKKIIDSLDFRKSLDFFYAFSDAYRKSRSSKYKQPFITKDKLKRPYVFLPMQVANDSVLSLSGYTPYILANHIIKLLKGHDIDVIIKPHPKEPFKILNESLTLKTNPVDSSDNSSNEYSGIPELSRHILNEDCFLSDGNIHDLIGRAECVITINSGVGLEALLLGKTVYNFGKSIYDYASNPMRIGELTVDNVINHRTNYSEIRIANLLFYLINYSFIDLNNSKSVRRKAREMIGAYNK